jgi:hypothetical protein
MYKDDISNKIYFRLNILDDISKELYKTIRNEEVNFQSYKNLNLNTTTSMQKENYIRYKTSNLELILSECLLNVINITINDLRNFYFKVPKRLLNTILTTTNNTKIVNCIIDCCDEILNNENEVDILKEERIMNKKIYDLRIGGNPNDKHNNNFLKTFNKNKTVYIKNGSNNKNLYARSFNRQKSNLMENQKSNFIQNLEKKYPAFRNSLKERRNISNFTDSNEKEKEKENANQKEIENLKNNFPAIMQNKKTEENNSDLSKVKNTEELRKMRFNRLQTNNFTNKSFVLK